MSSQQSHKQEEIRKISVKGDSDIFGGIRQTKKSRPRKTKKGEIEQETTSVPLIHKQDVLSDSPRTLITKTGITHAPHASTAATTSETSEIIPKIKLITESQHMNENKNQSLSLSHNIPTQTNSLKRNVRVVLNKPKISHKAVKLNPKKNIISDGKGQNSTWKTGGAASANELTAYKTKKSRKIVVGIAGLKRRITMAQKIRTKTSQTPIEILREELIKKGLLKSGSKTPDDLVRQIAADAQILSTKGL